MNSEDNIDPHLQHFIQIENQKQRFQFLIHSLTDRCWDMCIDTPATRLETKAENCLVNCVERFLDCSNFVINRLEKTQQYGAVTPEIQFQ